MIQDVKKIVADNITYLRKARGMTQIELAEKMNYSDKAVSKWERGESTPDVDSLAKLAAFFEVNVEFFFHKNSPEFVEQFSTSKSIKNRRILITIMSMMTVWAIPIMVFAVCKYTPELATDNCWIGFLWATPIVCTILALFFEKTKSFTGCLISYSLVLWTLLTSIYCSILVFKEKDIWMLFLLGVPLEAIIVLSRIMRRLGQDK